MFDVDVVETGPDNAMETLVELHQLYQRRLLVDSLPAWVRLDLTLPQLRLLYVLVHDGSQSVGALARLLGLTPPSVTGLSDRLVERGLATREEDGQDRRVVRLAATQAGRILLEELIAQRREQLTRLFDRLEPEERAELARSLRALLRAAGAPT